MLNLLEIEIVVNAFKGIQVGVGLIILRAGYNLYKKMKKNAFTIAILIIACLVMLAINFLGLSFSTIYMLLIAGVIGAIYSQIQRIKEGKYIFYLLYFFNLSTDFTSYLLLYNNFNI